MYLYRVLAFGEPFALDDRARMYGAEKNAFDLVWRALVNQEPVKCSATGKEFARTVKPTVVVVDVRHPTSSVHNTDIITPAGYASCAPPYHSHCDTSDPCP